MEPFQLILLAFNRAPPVHIEMYLNICMYYNICGEAAPSSEEQLQVYKRVDPRNRSALLTRTTLPGSLTYCQISIDRLQHNTMNRCLHPFLLCVADLVPGYPSANQESPDDSTRFPLHPSFEELEQAAEGGCELCGLIVNTFKSVDGRDTDSWEWPKKLLEKQGDGDVSVHHLVKRLPDTTDTKVRMYIGASGMYGAGTTGEPPVLDILMVHVGPHFKHDRILPTLKLKLRTRHRLESVSIYPSWSLGRVTGLTLCLQIELCRLEIIVSAVCLSILTLDQRKTSSSPEGG